MKRSFLLAAIVSASLMTLISSDVFGALITPLSAYGWPNGRTSNHRPSLSVDGNLNTYTWTTEAYNTASAHLGIDFSETNNVNHIRLWKDADAGNMAHTNRPKDLVIQYTTDRGAMSSRSWYNVSNLTNGILGQDLMNASAVNLDGTVIEDRHDSIDNGDGWASLMFDPIDATGIRISFSRTAGTSYPYVHYKVYEFQAYNTVPIPSTIMLISPVIACLFYFRKRRL